MSTTTSGERYRVKPDMQQVARWYRRSESRVYLQLTLLFSVLYFLFKARIYGGSWGWLVLITDLAVIVWIYWMSRQLPGRDALSFLFGLFVIYNFPSYVKEDVRSGQWMLAASHIICMVFAIYGVIITLIGCRNRFRIYSPKSPASVTIPQLCFATTSFCFYFVYLINKDDQPFRLPPHIDTDKWFYTLIFLIPGGLFALWLSAYYLQAFYFWLSDYMAARRKID